MDVMNWGAFFTWGGGGFVMGMLFCAAFLQKKKPQRRCGANKGQEQKSMYSVAHQTENVKGGRYVKG